MHRIAKSLIPLLVVLASACSGGGGDSTAPPPSYNDVSGSYSGPMSGIDQGVIITADFAVTIGQNASTLSGTYALTGQITDGVTTAVIQGTGTLAGTIAAGTNPSVNLTAHSGSCPNHSATFSGSYDTSNQRMTITGPVQIYSTDCSSVLLTYQTTFILNH